MNKWVILLLILLAMVVISATAEQKDVAEEIKIPITYTLRNDAFVTIVVEDKTGTRIRNLISGQSRLKGANIDYWDGRDDIGRPVPAGDYCWRGITHGAITTHFQGAFNTPGSPPWDTLQRPGTWYIRPSGSGGWLSDHERPLCAYSDGDRIFIGASLAEAGHSIIQIDPDGKKQWGTLWLSLSGANAIATDGDILYVAGEKGWMGNSLAVNRLSLKTYNWVGNPPDIQKKRTDACFVKEKSTDFAGIRGMVITAQYILLSLADRNRIVFFDREKANYIKEVSLPDAGMILKLRDGSIIGISGKTVVKINIESGIHEVIIPAGLSVPSGLGVDSKGQIYVSDIAAEEQCVKVFTTDGKMLRKIGKPGGRREGKYDQMTMNQPVALAIDNRDQIWVTEHDFLPKRVSVWNSDGKLIREYIGPPHYGGGGALDPGNGKKAVKPLQRAFYKGMEFDFKQWPETSGLKSILFRPEEHTDLPYPASDDAIPQYPVYRDGKLYLMNDAGYGVPGIFIGEVVKDHLVPRVIFGNLTVLWKAWKTVQPDFLGKYGSADQPAPQGVFLWQDDNGNGKAEPAEVKVQLDWQFGSMWAMRSWPTFDIYARYKGLIIELKPALKTGQLCYDFANARRITPLKDFNKYEICASSPDLDGNLLINCGGGGNQGDLSNVFMSMASDGKVRWTYPNPYPANWHNSPKPQTGDIQHTINVEGIVSLNKPVGDIFQLNGNKGVRYLFTTDGLFITQLYGDARIAPLQQNLSTATLNMRLDENSLGDECFSGWFGRGADGRIMQVIGKDSLNVAEVRGLQTLARLTGGTINLAISPQPRENLPTTARGAVKAIFAGGFGYTNGWEKLTQYSFPTTDPVARFAIGYQARGLRLWLDVKDDSPFENNGGDQNTLFHTGDAIDFRWSADNTQPANRIKPANGDQRFVVANYKGKPVVVRYQYIIPGQMDTPIEFASPTGVEKIARVTVVEKANVTIKKEEKSYKITIDIGWEDLGVTGMPNGKTHSDIGVIFGDSTSSRVVRRAYYFDPGSQEVSDIPAEVRISPAKWGEIQF